MAVLDAGERFDVGAESLEAFGEVFVAAGDGVDVAKNRAAWGGEHGQENDDGWA